MWNIRIWGLQVIPTTSVTAGSDFDQLEKLLRKAGGTERTLRRIQLTHTTLETQEYVEVSSNQPDST